MALNIHSNTFRVLVAFVVAASLFLVALGVSINNMNNIVHDYEELQHGASKRLQTLSDMFANGLLGGIAVRNKVFKPGLKVAAKVVDGAIKSFEEGFATISAAVPATDTTRIKLLADINKLWTQVKTDRLKVIELVEAGYIDEAAERLTSSEHPNWQQIRKHMQQLIAFEEKVVADRQMDVRNSADTAKMGSLAMGLVSLLLGALVMWLVMRSIAQGLRVTTETMQEIADGDGDLTRRLQVTGKDEIAELSTAFNRFVEKIHQLVREVVASTAQLAAAAEETSVITRDSRIGLERQHQETDLVATAVNEMSATINEVARNTAEAAATAQGANKETREGKDTVHKAITAISGLARDVQETAGTISELENESEQIGSVLDVIRAIAEQTNLLALNAAIEAARAGEHGRGFAVVADEVRTLASRTQQSTREIQEMIERLQAKAGQATKAMDASRQRAEATVVHANSTGSTLDGIADRMGRISDMNTHIATAAEEQSAVADEINKNISNIRQISGNAALNSEQMSEAAGNLARLASDLQALVNSFRV